MKKKTGRNAYVPLLLSFDVLSTETCNDRMDPVTQPDPEYCLHLPGKHAEGPNLAQTQTTNGLFPCIPSSQHTEQACWFNFLLLQSFSYRYLSEHKHLQEMVPKSKSVKLFSQNSVLYRLVLEFHSYLYDGILNDLVSFLRFEYFHLQQLTKTTRHPNQFFHNTNL